MTVKEFLERVREGSNKSQNVAFLMNLLTLLDEFEEEKCSVVSGKIRAQLAEAANQ